MPVAWRHISIHVIAASLGAASASCGGLQVPFVCDSDAACVLAGVQGRCELTRYCSFPDDTCAEASRYSELAGDGLASTCVAGCVRSLAAGAEHACALLQSGEVWCWGATKGGRVGRPSQDDEPQTTPVRVEGLPAIASLSAGSSHTCAIDEADGFGWCWGFNGSGQLGFLEGNGPTQISDAPEAAAAQVSAGGEFTCARPSGGVACWGKNNKGQLGVGRVSVKEAPAPITGFTAPQAQQLQEVAAGESHACVRNTLGQVHCWGDNGTLQVGVANDVEPQPAPQRLTTGVRAAQLSMGRGHSCMLTSEERVYCWGNNNAAGQLGKPTALGGSAIPLAVDLPDGMQRVSAGGLHTCALGGDGVAHCWGSNEFGQQGPGRSQSPVEPEPVELTLPGGIAEIQSGGFYTCARTLRDDVYCWGANDQGQLGNGETEAGGVSEPDNRLRASLTCSEP